MLNFLKRREPNKQSLVDIARARASKRDEISKPDHYYSTYSRFFDPIRDRDMTIFEVGVYQGESTKVLAEYFSKSHVVGIDFDLLNIDLTGFANITLYQGDQSDPARLNALADKHAPDGIDIVIDDASHEGGLSLETFRILFSRVKPAGLYAIEDWGTGYWADRSDGSAFSPVAKHGNRIVSHDYGMVGFVKHLVDHVASGDTRSGHDFESVASMQVMPGVVMLQKRA